MIIFTLNVSAERKSFAIKNGDAADSNPIDIGSFNTRGNVTQGNDDVSDATCSGILAGILPDLQSILKIIRIVGPLLVIVLSIFEYLSAITAKNDDALKKCNSRLIKRLILVALLFFLPIIINLILSFVNTKYTSCVE
jgi:hypothetical protein